MVQEESNKNQFPQIKSRGKQGKLFPLEVWKQFLDSSVKKKQCFNTGLRVYNQDFQGTSLLMVFDFHHGNPSGAPPKATPPRNKALLTVY